jgi:hypothetical protein
MQQYLAAIDTNLDVKSAAQLFRDSLDKRPLKYRIYKLSYSTPNLQGDAFSILEEGPDWAFAVIGELTRGDLAGSIFCGIANEGERRAVCIRGVDNRFGLATSGLVTHLVDRFVARDSSASVERSQEKF